MASEKLCHAILGTKELVVTVRGIIEQVDTIGVRILEHQLKIAEEQVKVHFYIVELTAPLHALDKYIQLLEKCPNIFYNESTNLIS